MGRRGSSGFSVFTVALLAPIILGVLVAPTTKGMILSQARRRCLYNNRNFRKYHIHWNLKMAPPSSSTTQSPTTQPEYEVEEKFALDSSAEVSRIQDRLRELGFEPSTAQANVRMVDWYWDARGDHETWPLSTQDCWLRYRQVVTENSTNSTVRGITIGNWQLKLGRKVGTSPESDRTRRATVYEEMEGPDAVAKAMALLPNTAAGTRYPSSLLLDAFLKETKVTLPTEIVASADAVTSLLAPFAKIVTQRSSWIPSAADGNGDVEGLKVDLDQATYGGSEAEGDVYAVGEVEQVVHREGDIDRARMRVQAFTKVLLQFSGDEPSGSGVQDSVESEPAIMGKLEHYLSRYRPKHFKDLVDKGVL